MRRKFLQFLGLSFILNLLPPINFLYATTKKLFNKELTEKQKNIMFNEGTERPFSSKLNKEKTGKNESEVIKIMRKNLKPSSFRLWRKRVHNKSIKHRKKFKLLRKKMVEKIKIDSIY